MKGLVYALILVLLVTALPGAVSANITPLSTLERLEKLVFGEHREGALIQRVEDLEMLVFGSGQDGAVMLRIDRIQSYLQSTNVAGGSLMLQLNMAEWGFLAFIKATDPLLERLSNLEMALLGEEQSGPIRQRAESLMRMIWGTTSLDVRSVQLPRETLIKIRMLTSVDSGTSQVGDIVRYRVVEDVMVEGRIVIPAGLEVQGQVAEVTSAARLGRDGRVVIDFGHVVTIDGLSVPVVISERATERNSSLEWAAGASMAGVLLLGPIGLVSGYFIRGRDVEIPATTQFYIETSRPLQTSGLLLRPAQP